MPGVHARTSVGSANPGGEAATRTQSNAKDRLARTTAAMDAVKAMQRAARAAAGAGRIKNPNGNGKLPRVPDGLGNGGLQVAAGVPKNLNKPRPGENPGLWIGAKLPKETGKKGGAKNVTIIQTEQQAILNWETFNIGKKTSLYFDQTKGGADKGKWVAFNKVNDPKGRPSQILGSLKADGQVYVINRNGIIFGASSQVNTHTLVASALPINDGLIARGLLNNPDSQFLFSAVEKDAFDLTVAPKTLSEVVDSRSKLELQYT
ncbi:MAG: filamentous hemagglutinin N-terminal domain-containing protein, partial [Bradyrhizobium sp.]